MFFDQQFDVWLFLSLAALCSLCAWRVSLGAAGFAFLYVQSHLIHIFFSGGAPNSDAALLWSCAFTTVLVSGETSVRMMFEFHSHRHAHTLLHLLDYFGFATAVAGSFMMLPLFSVPVSIALALVVGIAGILFGSKVRRCVLPANVDVISHRRNEKIRTLIAVVLLLAGVLFPLISLIGMAALAVLRCTKGHHRDNNDESQTQQS